jgi:hypothetical protein
VSEPEAALQRLAEAIQEHANAVEDGALVSQAVVLYETVSVNDDGDTERAVFYTVPTDNFAVSGALGLCYAGLHMIRRDGIGGNEAL